jgi:hypothetical protein
VGQICLVTYHLSTLVKDEETENEF